MANPGLWTGFRTRMHPRLVDRLLLILVLWEGLSGLGTFLMGKPEGQWLFRLHGITGLALVVLLGWKMARVSSRIRPRRWRRSTLLSVAVFLLAVTSIGTGVVWVSFQIPFGYPNGLNLHVMSGLLLLLGMVVHAWIRHKPLTWQVLRSRRNFMAGLGMGAVGLGAYWVQDRLGRQLQWRGAQRRFTGSRQVEGNLPVTMWMFDTVPEIDPALWRLQIGGEVRTPLDISLETLQKQPFVRQKVTLDCTGGWFKEEVWAGVPVASLLDMAGAEPASRYVSFCSLTGYRWSLSLAEARKAMLALHLDDRPLTPAHGAPVRLVIPGHRGFQWVKWVTEMRVLAAPDPGQWGAIFTSGL